MAGLQIDRRRALALSLGGIAAATLPRIALAAETDAAWVDPLVQEFMTGFEVPGIAVAIVRAGQPPFLKGYGVRTLGKPGAVDAHTRFGIASNSKSFTAACLAILADEGRLGWEDPVVKHLPEFRMHDPAVTQMMTVRDLLVHRSGLPLGAGDLMYFPASARPAGDVLKALPYLTPDKGFRAGYAYDNILYIVAGLLIERVSGKSWRDFVATRIMAPLGMADAVPSRELLRTDNVAGRHARLGPPVRGMGRQQVVGPDETPAIDAAGGINASVGDVAKWLTVQLAHGQLPDGKRLWSEAQAAEMWKPQTIIGSSDGPTPDNPTRAVTQSYALGWFVSDYRGERLVAHDGGLTGQVTRTAMLPARGIGVVVLSNVEDPVSIAIRNAMLDHVMGAPAFDWSAAYAKRIEASQAAALKELGAGGVDTPPAGGPSLPLAAYAGRYRDPWYGDVVVTEQGGKLAIDFVPTPVFKSALEPWGKDAFRTRFAKDAGEDAVVTFAVADGRVIGVAMKPLSPLADFSYDFQHLAFVPVR
ncbi:serine hydrolase [Sphingomonas cannabina]|uniref:serine hydrolase n=1 Tax=Sphingomonas cannabina TaxID=2899123 RepID=UPI001F2E82C4|nr:serine hydrolase [Sphingomonas cannabina]UIJ46113.1 serine hydrolase [Sphingomonas cannabina]